MTLVLVMRVACVAVTLLACVSVILVACVSAGEEEDPRGAVAFEIVPSEAARGEPIETLDGWTVRIEALHVQARSSARSVGSAGDREALWLPGYAGTIDGSGSLQLVAPGIEAGPAEVRLATEAPPFPSVSVRARAEKDGRAVVLDARFPAEAMHLASVDVSANALTTVRAGLNAEALFGGFSHYEALCADGAVVNAPIRMSVAGPAFEDLAAADEDGDGTLSPVELEKKRPPTCACCASETEWPEPLSTSILDVLSFRGGALFSNARD